MKTKSKEQALILQKIKNHDEVRDKELIPKQTNKIGKSTDLKSLCVILAHLLRLEEADNKEIKEDVGYVLSKAPFLLQMMIEVGI
mmetsp:Transcript_40300/g.38773  ORF Transcript_40300/g.38773 Transcript_40300/m.38773 type:complete len:85 (+) Transcript_40300:812-1066(+)